MAFRGQKLPRASRIWMSDRSLHPHQAHARRLQGFLWSSATAAAAAARAQGVGKRSGAGAEPGTAPAGPPRPGLLETPAELSGPGAASPPALPSPQRSDPGSGEGGWGAGGTRHTGFRSVTGRYDRQALCPPPLPGALPPPPSPAPHRHRTPESRSQPVVIAIQEAVQDAGEILRPQFLLFFALPWRPGETTRQRGKG